MINLTCPTDGGTLTEAGHNYICQTCSRKFNFSDGIVCFIDKRDNFYEGTYTNTINYVPKRDRGVYLLPLWIVSNGYVWFTRKYVPENSVVLELGCASGVKYFGTRYKMIGMDISFSSLLNIGNHYEIKINCNATEHIPLPDYSIDAVISSYFWEHFNENDKLKILEEIKRILKPEGKIIFLYDLDTLNPIINKIKEKNISFYNSYFLEKDGHFGYQNMPSNEKLFLMNNFEIFNHISYERFIFQSNSIYSKMKNMPGYLGVIGRIGNFISSGVFLKPYLFFLRIFDETIGRLFPKSWGNRAIIVAINRNK
jgi:ubiquinone/menaquinone biosynthesis C-methylase UbiE